MNYQGIIITGKKGAGKSEITGKFCAKYKEFERVKAVTTRNHRSGDSTREYKFLSKEDFAQYKEEKKFLIETEYMGNHYGITFDSYEEVIKKKKIPILVITPKSANEFISKEINGNSFLTIFLNAPDKDLNKRLENRGEEINDDTKEQRERDEEFAKDCLYILENANNVRFETIIELIFDLWNYKDVGGMCSKSLISLMIKGGMLLEDINCENIQGASYDLRLGDEYFHRGKIKKLNKENPIIVMNPGDYVLASSIENCNFPKDIAGRFDLSVGLFFKGVILSNGPQIDPGFQGKLFCLLFNTSNEKVQLKRGAHFATIEFIKLIEPTEPYKGNYQGKYNIQDYLTLIVKESAINKLIKDVGILKRERFWLKLLPIILALVGLTIALLNFLGKGSGP